MFFTRQHHSSTNNGISTRLQLRDESPLSFRCFLSFKFFIAQTELVYSVLGNVSDLCAFSFELCIGKFQSLPYCSKFFFFSCLFSFGNIMAFH